MSPRASRCAISVAMVGCVTALSVGTAVAAPTPQLTPEGTIQAPARTQVSFEHTPTRTHLGTANEHESRPGLSIVKLYIADYVYAHGTEEEKAKADRMIRFSDDALASELYAKYPQSINDTAAANGLSDTHGAGHWGDSTTSTYDSVRFVEMKKRANPSDRLLVAMATASPVAADGYRQDYGTAVLPGVIGTKWGWSDDRRSVHASVSYGPDFSVSANTYGTKDDLTADVRGAFAGSGLPGAPQLSSNSQIREAAARLADQLEAALRAVPIDAAVKDPAIARLRAELDRLIAQLP